ncbi:MAG: TCP-1/cpn60 chaperonin family protein [Candidatus Heimdallarchaeota archaeon]|nr:TCP-1/cpn60 chaperonin family protein [Candidatus Heimdallarchaeota archaeon]MBY8993345.1 TCP-1/cpn60 chaperonin family protein [Candidatus Heimdallarchaeota archaeon]
MSLVQIGGQQVLLLREGTERTQGRNAQQNNIAAAKIVAEAIRSALGPRGLDKMLVDSFGDVVITNDGATILKEMEIQHPAAKFVVELAKVQDDEVGDGTTTVVVIAGELLKQAEELLSQDVHASIIVDGYRKATIYALDQLDKLAIQVDISDREMLKESVRTSMSSKVIAGHSQDLAEIVINAALQITVDEGGKKVCDIDNVKIEKKKGESIKETELIKGIVLDKSVVHSGMPKKIDKAKILLLDVAIEITKTEFDAKINITNPDQMKAFLDQEQQMIEDMVDKVIATGANVILSQKGIDDLAQHFFAKKGVMAVRRIKKSDMEKLSMATGATLVTRIEGVDKTDLGQADVVEERKIGDDDFIFVEGCPNPKSVSILIRGGSDLIVDEAERSIHDALCVIRNIIQDGLVVPGGGAPEIYLSRKLKVYANTLSGREQLAVEKFAEALEIIPRTLAENAGLDPIDALVALRAAHDKGSDTAGVNLETGKPSDMVKEKVFEPVSVARQAISSASEAAQMILRIDDIIAAKSTGGMPGGGMPGGMPGGPDMDDF